MKTGTIRQFESALERDFLILLEFDDHVTDYVVQPTSIIYMHNDKIARYTPDAIVHFTPDLQEMPLLCEIKYVKELQTRWDYYQPKFMAALDYAVDHGLVFKVITEVDIRLTICTILNF